MAKTDKPIEVYIEAGKKKTIASAVGWPGWCRGGKDEESALQALVDYGPRYAKVAKIAKLDFKAPGSAADFDVVERQPGNATTDFGAPGLEARIDERPVDGEDLRQLQALLEACYQAMDQAAREAEDKTLRKGPRGGGRELEEIARHVADAGDAYLTSLGWKQEKAKTESLEEQLARLRCTTGEGLAAAARGETEQTGPRGGKRWSLRYFARRAGWHIMDHAWEIEDRAE